MSQHSEDSQGVKERLIERFRAAAPEVACAYLFGSHARGQARADSDVDVLLDEDPPATVAGLRPDLADDLASALHRPVDLVILNQAPPDLVHRILRDGILVCERDRPRRVHFEVRKRNEYFDFLPYLLQYRRVGAARADDRS